jgi:hypothetical protein
MHTASAHEDQNRGVASRGLSEKRLSVLQALSKVCVASRVMGWQLWVPLNPGQLVADVC